MKNYFKNPWYRFLEDPTACSFCWFPNETSANKHFLVLRQTCNNSNFAITFVERSNHSFPVYLWIILTLTHFSLNFLKKSREFRWTLLLRSSKLEYLDAKNMAIYNQNLMQNRMNLFLAFERNRKLNENCKNQIMLEKRRYKSFAV